MKFLNAFLLLLSGLLVSVSCTSQPAQIPGEAVPADKNATRQTKALYYNLKQLQQERILYGHQDDLAYGIHWENEPGRSDVKEVSGSYPAVYGWDVGDIGNEGAESNLDGVSFDNMREWIKEGYRQGAVITISWHMDNPVTGGGSWDTTKAAAKLLPGNELNSKYQSMLDRFAAFVKTLKIEKEGKEVMIPIIFRPFHEFSGSFFWWGKNHITATEFKQLWKFTIDYLQQKHELHNLLYAYSPNALSEFENEEYWNRYPGDDYVDLLGFDDYYTLQGGYGHEDGIAALGKDLAWLVEQARERGKIAALTETGQEGFPDHDWWMMLLDAFKSQSQSDEIAYVLTWRNAPEDKMEGHFFGPAPGHPSAEYFKKFASDTLIWLQDDLPDLYTFK